MHNNSTLACMIRLPSLRVPLELMRLGGTFVGRVPEKKNDVLGHLPLGYKLPQMRAKGVTDQGVTESLL